MDYCPKMIPENCIGIWGVFRECVSFFTTQEMPELLVRLFEYVCAEDEKYDKTKFYLYHWDAIWTAKELRAVFRKEVIPAFPGIYRLDEEQLHVFINNIRAKINIRFASLIEKLLPGLSADLITALSGEVYENKRVDNQSLVILPSIENLDKEFGAIIFDADSRINLRESKVHAIRKQLQMCNEGSSLVAVRTKKGFETAGIALRSISEKYPTFVFCGHMEWNLCIPIQRIRQDAAPRSHAKVKSVEQLHTMCPIRCLNGSLLLPKMPVNSEFAEAAQRTFCRGNVANKVGKVISKIQEVEHGAVIVIASENRIKNECSRLTRENHRGISLNKKRSLISKKADKIIKKLTSIDGAILVDTNGYCHACGVILDGIAVEGTPARGARYNCTKSYISLHARMMGVVLSEDGMIDCFPECEVHKWQEFDFNMEQSTDAG